MDRVTQRIVACSACLVSAAFEIGLIFEGGSNFQTFMRIAVAVFFLGFCVKVAMRGVE